MHDWEIEKNMYSPGTGTDSDPPGPGAWMDVGPYDFDFSEDELDPESPRYNPIP